MAKVMVVDDHKDIVNTLTQIVEKVGATVHTADSGEKLLAEIDKAKPDLLLLDVMMPGLTTEQILNSLKEKGYNKLKIILITVVRFADSEIKSLEQKFNIVGYVTKPFDLIDLTNKIKKALKGKG